MSQRQKPSLSWILILFVLIWLNGSSFTQSPQGQIPAGDADGDGFLSLFDLDALLDAVLAKEEAPGDADFNSDGEVNVADLAGLRDYFFTSDPSEIVPRVEVEIEDTTLTPDQQLDASWTVRGIRDFSGLETVVRLVEPGTALVAEETSQVTPGSAPANGASYYWTAVDWAQTEGAFSAGRKEGELDSEFPGDLEGEWRLEVELRRGEETVASGSASLLRSSGAAIHLSINRTLANTLDRIEVDLMTAAGEEEQQIVLAATLILPDESQLILPGLFEQLAVPEGVENPLFLQKGVLEDAEVELLDRNLSGYGEGLYQVSVKMNDLENGTLLALASASFQVCDTPAQVTGTVTEGGQPLGGEGALAASVSAEDLDDELITARAEISEDGSYQLGLVPGRYRLTAAVADTEGLHEGEFGEIVTIGCDGEGREADIETELVSEVDLTEVEAARDSKSGENNRQMAPQQGMGGRPSPRVVIIYGSPSDPQFKPHFSNFEDAFRQFLSNLGNIQFGIGGGQSVDYWMDVIVSAQDRPVLDDRFRAEVTIRSACDITSRQLASTEVTSEDPASAMTTLGFQTINEIVSNNPFLAAGLDLDRPEPLEPQLDLISLSPDRLDAGEVFTAILSLIDAAANGEEQEGQDVTIDVYPNGSFTQKTFSGTTNNNGLFLENVTVGQGETGGEVFGTFEHCVRADPIDSNSRFYSVSDAPGSIRLDPPIPPYEVPAGQPVDIHFQVFSLNSPAPLEDIALVATGGSLSSSLITTNSNGIASVIFTPPAQNGPAVVGASLVDGFDSILVDFNVTGEAEIDVNAGGSPQPLPTTAGLSRSPQGSRDVPVTASLRIGVDRVENQPVVFSLQGPGSLTASNGQTDEFGVVSTVFVPPEDAGMTTLTGTSIVNGVTVSDSVDIDYEPLAFTATHLGGIATDNAWGQGWPFASRLNDLGQAVGHDPGSLAVSLWLPRAAYGLSAGLNPLNGCPAGKGGGGSVCTGGARGISNSGQILLHGLLWANGSASVLEHAQTYAAMNSQGQIVGSAQFEDDDGFTRKAYRTTAGGRQFLEPGSGYSTSDALSINDNGDVVGQVTREDRPRKRVAMWPADSTNPTFISGPLTSGHAGIDINNRGQILVADRGTGWVWENGTITNLPGDPGFIQAQAINDSGVVVGCNGLRAALWIEGERMLLHKLVVDPEGLILSCAVDINSDGEILASDLNDELWLLKPR